MSGFAPRAPRVGEPTMTVPTAQIEELVRRTTRTRRDLLLDDLLLGATVLVWAAVVAVIAVVGVLIGRILVLVLAAVVVAVSLSACGGTSSSSGGNVWCVAPGERVTAAFKREYPELYISRAACAEANR